MSKRIRFSFKSVFICVGITIAAIGAAMLVDFSPASLRQNVPATKPARSGLSGGLNRPASVAGSPANRLVANYGKLPLSFEANQGQTDGQVKFLSRGRGYSLFLTGDEAVLTLEVKSSVVSGQSSVRAGQKPGVTPTFRSAVVGASSAGPRPNAVRPYTSAALPNLLSFPSPGMNDGWGQEMEKPPRSIGALPSSSRLADSGESSAVLRMRLVGANADAPVMGADELPGKSNYFIGNDPKKWRTNVPNYAKVKYADVYPGVDLVYYGNQGGQLEYDFVVAPGADPSVIALDVAAGLSRHSSAENGGVKPPLQIAVDGDLVVKTDGGEVRFHKPVVYQPAISNGPRTSDLGLRTSVDGHYILDASNRVQFQVASYDHSKPLFIDPVLVYSTYLGGNNFNQGLGIAVDSSGNAFVAGLTYSTDFPTVNPLRTTNTGGSDVFVAKLNAAGTALVYSTYLGGSLNDYGLGIAVDSSDNAYVTGYTFSTDFPTVKPLQASYAGGGLPFGDAFVAKLNAAGSALVYSTYLGGSAGDYGQGIAVDASGNAYVAGGTGSTDFPTVNPLQATNRNGGANETAFVAKLNAAGSALVYSTYLGGSAYEYGSGIAVDSSGSAYVTGDTGSTDFPTVNPLQAAYGGNGDAFVAKLNSAGSGLVYSTYLGGELDDGGQAVAVDSFGNAYVTGYTFSAHFPTVKPLQPTRHSGPYNTTAFVAKVNADGSALVYSTYLGGSANDYGLGIVANYLGDAYVTGYTDSSDFPTVNPLQANPDGYTDAFVAKLNAAGSAFVYSTYLGGIGQGYGSGIAVDSSGKAYLTGWTSSTDFPTVDPLQASNAGAENAVVAKISSGPEVTLAPTGLTFASQEIGTTSAPQSVTVSNIGDDTLSITSIVASGDFAQTNNCASPLAPSGSCTISVTITPTQAGTRSGAVDITDNASGSPQTITLTGAGGFAGAGLSSTALSFGYQAENSTSAARAPTLASTGTTNLNISSITITGMNAGDFVETNNCPASMAPATACTITLTYTPTLLGAETANLTVTDNAANSPQTVVLSGSGALPAVLSPTSLIFGGQAENATSPPRAVTLINTQSTALTISSVTTSGDFAQTNTCGSSVPAGGRCTISVTYTPSSLGVESGTLTVTDGASNSPQIASLAGRGILQAQLSTPSVAFAAQTVGNTSPAWNVLFGNNLTTALPISITFAGADPGDFAQTNTCNGSVAPRSMCTISIAFTPTAMGSRTATLTVTDSANNSPQTMALSGTGD